MNISIEEMPRELDRLLEENERLEEQLKRYKKRDFISKTENIDITETMIDTKDSMYQKLSLYSNELEDKVEELQHRIDKAIEYINEMTLTSDGYADYGDDLRPEHIVEILKGGDKE